MQISIFGTGYVGLVTGVCFAEMGNDVICADIDQGKIQQLNDGGVPIYEPGLEKLVQSNLKESRLQFTIDLVHAVKSSEIIFIAVGTPSDEDGSADLSHVLKVAQTIGEHMTGYRTVIVKSTVPVGTCQKVKDVLQKTLQKRGSNLEFSIISNPEFLKEGTAVDDCLNPSRVVVGCESDKAEETMRRLYEPFLLKTGNPIHCMDLYSAEMTKYASNAMLATKISFMNELSRVCERVGADIESVRVAMGSDPRIGHHFIYAGVGYGGSCFPKDVRALIKSGEQVDEELKILSAVKTTNDLQRQRFCQKIEKFYNGDLKGKTFAVWGLAFKPGTDDVREAPALDLIMQLHEAGAAIRAFDPAATETTQKALGPLERVTYLETPYDALKGVDALCIMAEWAPFREPNIKKMRELMKQPVIFDGRNLYSLTEMKEHGFRYLSVGRPQV
jgi:UDPglucose 6-dehydrogenase